MRISAVAVVLLATVATISVAFAATVASLGSAVHLPLWGEAMNWIVTQQRTLQLQLTDNLRALTADGGVGAAWALIGGSALYGLFHAAGPDHGKAVLTTYLLTHRRRMGRGIAMAAAAALCQGAVALLLVYGLIYLAGWLPRDTSAAVDWSERMSYALVAAIGAALVLRAAKAGYRSYRHDDHHHGEEQTACECGHLPTAKQMDRARDLRTAIGVVLSIGLRPCSGAVLVLVFARALDLPWAGVGAMVSISVGTAVAVMTLACLAVRSRDWAASLGGGESVRWRLAANGVAGAGGCVLIAVGASFMAATFTTAHPLGL